MVSRATTTTKANRGRELPITENRIQLKAKAPSLGGQYLGHVEVSDVHQREDDTGHWNDLRIRGIESYEADPE
jgi:hypothetical protein